MPEEKEAGSFLIRINTVFNKNGLDTSTSQIMGLFSKIKKGNSALQEQLGKGFELFQDARYINTSTHSLEKWRIAMQLAGGEADEANSSLLALSQSYERLKIGKENGLSYSQLGISMQDLRNFDSYILRLRQIYANTGDKGRFRTLAEELGITRQQMYLITMQHKQFDSIMSKAGKYTYLDKQSETLNDLFLKYKELGIVWDRFKSQMVVAFSPAVNAGLSKLMTLFSDTKFQNNMADAVGQLSDALIKFFNGKEYEKFVQWLNDISNKANAALDSMGGIAEVLKATGTFLGWIHTATAWSGTKAGEVVGSGLYPGSDLSAKVAQKVYSTNKTREAEESFKKMYPEKWAEYVSSPNASPWAKTQMIHNIDITNIFQGDVSKETIKQVEQVQRKTESDLQSQRQRSIQHAQSMATR